MTSTRKTVTLTVRVSLTWLALLAIVIWVALALAGCGSSAAKSVARPASVTACTTAFEGQIRYAQEKHLVHPDLPLPASCTGLSAAQSKEAALTAVIALMP